MDSKLLWIIRESLKKVWVRVVSFAVVAILTVGLAPWLGSFVPAEVGAALGSVPVDQILSILASSMLAVTTFSLSIAVSAFAAAASTATPRATELLQEDPTTQNVLATFLGAFLFGLIGMIALRADFYDRSAQVFLFLATLVVVALVLAALLRWISHLMSFGRMGDTLDRVERAVVRAFESRLATPYLGGKPLRAAIPRDALRVTAPVTGYVQHVDIGALSECADKLGAEVYLEALPGRFVHIAAPLLWVHGAEPAEKDRETLCKAFTLGNQRSFDQDPRFGLIVLSEIASRALSPGVNDPGTAIGVIGRLVRVLSAWVERAEPPVDHPLVHVPPELPLDMMYDAFRPIARDGAALIEVQVRLHKALDALNGIAPTAYGQAAAEISSYALERAKAAGMSAEDLDAVKAAAVGPKAIRHPEPGSRVPKI